MMVTSASSRQGGADHTGAPFLRPILAVFLAAELGLTALLVLAPTEGALVATCLVTGSAVLIAAHFVLPPAEREPLLVLFAAGLLIRLTAMFAVHYTTISPQDPYGLLFRDSLSYDRVGWDIAEHWRHGRTSRIEYLTSGYTIGFHYFVGAVYAVAGHVPLVVKALIALLSACLVPLTFLLGRRLAGRRAGFTAALLMAFWPPVILWSTHILKDIPITLLLLLAALGWVAFAHRPRLIALAGVILPATPLIFLRNYMFLCWAVGVAVGLAAIALRRRRPFLSLVVATAVLVAGWWAATEYSPLRTQNLEVWTAQLNAVGNAPGSLLGEINYRRPSDLLEFLPLGFMRFLLTPLPWKGDPIGHWPENLGSIFRYALLPFAAWGLFHLFRREREATLPVVVCGCLAVSLYGLAFRGGIPRHWTQFYPYFFVFAAAGLPRFPDWPLPIAFIWGCFLAGAFFTWPRDFQSILQLALVLYAGLAAIALLRRRWAERRQSSEHS